MTRQINFMKTAAAGVKHMTGTRHERRAEEAILDKLVSKAQKQLRAQGINMSNDELKAAVFRKRLI